MALISRELKERGAYTGILLAIGAFLLNGEIVTKNYLIDLGKFGVVPAVVANAIMRIMAQFLPRLRELSQEGESGKREIKKLTKELALIITTAEAYLTHSSLIEIPFQLGATYALSEITERFETKGLGNGLTNLFVMQLLKDIAKESSLLLATNSITQLLTMGALTLPLVGFAILYNQCEQKIDIVCDNKIKHTTHHITKNISVSFTSKIKNQNTLPIRSAAAGTMPIMHALSLFMITGLDMSWLALFGIILVFIYILETTQVINTHEIAKQLKKLNIYIKSIRPGTDTKAYLNKILKRAILIGIPFILILGLYPFLVFGQTPLIGAIVSVPFLVCEAQNIARQIKSYNLDYDNLRGICLC